MQTDRQTDTERHRKDSEMQTEETTDIQTYPADGLASVAVADGRPLFLADNILEVYLPQETGQFLLIAPVPVFNDRLPPLNYIPQTHTETGPLPPLTSG